MKTKNVIIAALCLVFTLACFNTERAYSQQVQANFQIFHDQLSPYGSWIETPEYGMVWSPNVGRDFEPYSTAGYWVYSDYGWTWVSDYEWGWAPFHYGRWHNDIRIGWYWVPEYEWAPAWVVWRHSKGYYGWSPLEPRVSLEVAIGPKYIVPQERWHFVSEKHILNRHPEKFYAPRERNSALLGISIVLGDLRLGFGNGFSFFVGPSRGEVERIRRKPITPFRIENYSKPGHQQKNNSLYFYRPSFDKGGVHAVGNSEHRPFSNGTTSKSSSVGTKRESDRNIKNNAVKSKKLETPRDKAPQNRDRGGERKHDDNRNDEHRRR